MITPPVITPPPVITEPEYITFIGSHKPWIYFILFLVVIIIGVVISKHYDRISSVNMTSTDITQ